MPGRRGVQEVKRFSMSEERQQVMRRLSRTSSYRTQPDTGTNNIAPEYNNHIQLISTYGCKQCGNAAL